MTGWYLFSLVKKRNDIADTAWGIGFIVLSLFCLILNPTLKQLITPFWGYGASVPGPYDGMSFFIGEINLIVLIITTLYLVFRFSKISVMIKKISIWCLFLVIISVFMMNFRSTWFWKNIPLIAYFQFPWRFLTMIVLASSLLVVLIKNFKYSKLLAVIIIVVSIAINTPRFRPHDFLARRRACKVYPTCCASGYCLCLSSI
jgi:hypothetical protein